MNSSQPPVSKFRAVLAPLFMVPLIATALVAGGFLPACTNKTKEKSSEPVSATERKALDEYRAELEIGRNMAGRLLAYYGQVDDESLIGYVNQVGNYVASYSDHPERRYMFRVLNNESVNAFACPGGYILVTLGALRTAKDEAELAAILGHETAHVGLKHMYNTLAAMKEREIEEAAKKGAQQNEQAGRGIRMRERPKADETATGAMVARYLSGSSGAGLNILQAAQAGMNLITEKGLSKDLEFEADNEGVKYAIRAGYDPKGMLSYLTRLEQASQRKLKNLGKTHPSAKARKRLLKVLLKNMKADEITGATGKDRYDDILAKLPKPAA